MEGREDQQDNVTTASELTIIKICFGEDNTEAQENTVKNEENKTTTSGPKVQERKNNTGGQQQGEDGEKGETEDRDQEKSTTASGLTVKK